MFLICLLIEIHFFFIIKGVKLWNISLVWTEFLLVKPGYLGTCSHSVPSNRSSYKKFGHKKNLNAPPNLGTQIWSFSKVLRTSWTSAKTLNFLKTFLRAALRWLDSFLYSSSEGYLAEILTLSYLCLWSHKCHNPLAIF